MHEDLATRLRAVTVADATQAAQALRAVMELARAGLSRSRLPEAAPPGSTIAPLLLLSPPAAALWLSPGLFLAILAEAASQSIPADEMAGVETAGVETAGVETAGVETAGAAAVDERPGIVWRGALDCGASPGHAVAALRAGVTILVLEPGCPAFPQIAAAANRIGATVWPRRPPTLDAARLDRRPEQAQAQLVVWLSSADPAS